MVTTVVNIHKINGKRPYFDVYIGRATRNTEFEDDSFWANPYRRDDPDWRNKYRSHISKRLEQFGWRKILELDDKILGCWCKPLDCHGDILIELLNNYKERLEIA